LTSSFEKFWPACQAKNAASADRRFEFHKRSLLFIRTHNKTLSVAMRVHNPDPSPVEINRRSAAPTPTGFAEIVSDDFPGFHLMSSVAPFR
jgi:hypothetical protein